MACLTKPEVDYIYNKIKDIESKRARIMEIGSEPFFERALKSILRKLKGSAPTND